jgi:hypothetical protein
MIPDGSCKRIKQTGWASWNGTYAINPAWVGDVSVYCDMETAWGGWTLIARSISWGSWNFSIPTTWSLSDLTSIYKAHWDEYPISFSERMLATYTSWRNIVLSKTLDAVSIDYIIGDHTLGQWWITGGVALDGYNWEQGMIFIK